MNDKPPLNAGYAAGQIDKALLTAITHADPDVRERAAKKLDRWMAIMRMMTSGSTAYGSRTPIANTPAWVTLDVAQGGFATGALLAGGELRPHERDLLRQLPPVEAGDERRAINAWFIGAGFGMLREWLASGCYRVDVPEEAALLTVVWLADNGHADEARELLEILQPWFARLRFYPEPTARPTSNGSRLHLQDVGQTLKGLAELKPHRGVQAQKEAVLVWAPEYDAAVALALETVIDGSPGAHIPPGWPSRVRALLDRYAKLRATHDLCKRPEDLRDHFAQVRAFLQSAAAGEDLSPALIGRQRVILERYLRKRGTPDSAQCRAQRALAAAAVAAPLRHAFIAPIRARLGQYPASEPLSSAAPMLAPLRVEEAHAFDLPEHAALPDSLIRKIERCVEGTAEELVQRGLVTSGDALAGILPQMIASIRASSAPDDASRRLHAASYRAFRRRRSLLLLNLATQVRVEELPWFAALERHCARGVNAREIAKRTLADVSAITLASFPFAIIPNKLLQELRILAKDAGLDLPLTEELAADIFMGRFSGKFIAAAKSAAGLLENSLYYSYYGIDAAAVRALPEKSVAPPKRWFRGSQDSEDPLNALCRRRAGVGPGQQGVASNGSVIEQQQILTTQNLAVLFQGLGLAETLRAELPGMVRRCFEWICDRQQVRYPDRHSRLIMLKNTAYAWRQMIFFLTVMGSEVREASLADLRRHFDQQPESFRSRFAPAMHGLMQHGTGQVFLGWTGKPHWLMPEDVTGR
jgi:hypothetical protein